MGGYLDGISEAFARNRESAPTVGWLLAGLVVLLLLWTAWVARRAREHRRALVAALAKSFDLTPQEFAFVTAAAERDGCDPGELLTSLEVFERATGRALVDGGEGAAKHTHTLRRRLRFDRVPLHVPLFTTRELTVGAHVAVQGDDGVILAVDEQRWVVRLPSLPRFQPGAPAEITLQHGAEARYLLTCAVRLVRNATPGVELELAHDEAPVRQQLRAWVRVGLTGPIAVRPLPWPGRPPPPGPFDGRLRDLSGGGALLESDVALAPGTLVEASFQVGALPFALLAGVVLRCEPDGEAHLLHVEFTGLDEEGRDALVAALTALELEREAARREGRPLT